MTRYTALDQAILIVLAIIIVGPELTAGEPFSQRAAHGTAIATDWVGSLSLLFEENRGQVAAEVKYFTRVENHAVFFTPDGVIWNLPGPPAQGQNKGPGDSKSQRSRTATIWLEILGRNPESFLVAGKAAPTRTSYLRGSDPSKWTKNVPNFGQVTYESIYPGIDMVFYGNRQHLEYDFVVEPGVDPGQIRLKFKGPDSMHVTAEGEVVLSSEQGELRQLAPSVCQNINGQKTEIASRYRVDEGVLSFELGPYDKSAALTIDPVLVYSTYLGGSKDEVPGGIATDSAGNVYIVGNTGSLDFPTLDPYQEEFAGGGTPNGDVFVTKMDSSGDFITYSTYIGGASTDIGRGIDVDSEGRALITGTTFSGDFPSTAGSFQTSCSGQCPFVVRLSADGSEMSYGTFVGRGDGTAIASDTDGRAVITGRTSSSDFPVSNAFQPDRAGGSEAFVTRLNLAGTGLVFSSYLGGSGDENLIGKNDIAMDTSRNIYITGRTDSTDFPVVNPIQAANNGEQDAFVVKLNALGGMVYSTYLGGNLDDVGQGIDADSVGNAVVVGNTKSLNFPVVEALQPNYGGGVAVGDAFVAKIPPAGGSLLFSTYLGGQLGDTANDVSIDGMGRPVVVGNGASNFPVSNPLRAFAGIENYVAKLLEDGSNLFYSTPIGGGDQDVFVATLGTEVFATGNISSGNFPVFKAMQPRSAGGTEVFVTRVSDGGTLYFAQFANGTGAVSEILLTASSASTTASARVTIRDDDGELFPVNVVVTENDGSETPHDGVSELDVLVPPLGMVKITSDGVGTPKAGSVTVDFDVPIGGLIRFTLSPFGTAGVGASELVRGFISPVRKKMINTGVALYNPEDKQIGLTMRLRDLSGTQIQGGLVSTAIGPHEHFAIFIDQLFPSADLTDFEGTLTVETSSFQALFVATALELGTGAGQFTTLPVTPLP